MKTPASVAGHPLHPMIVTIPIGLWIFSLVLDFGSLAAGTDRALWSTMAWYSMVGGCIGAALAAIPGVIDLFSLTDPRLRRIGMIHGSLNVAALISFAVNAFARSDEIAAPGPGLVVLSAVTLFVLAASGWLGAHLVHVHRVGVLEAEPAPPRPMTATEAQQAQARANWNRAPG